MKRYPRVLGIDDAPFRKGQRDDVAIVGVVMEGVKLVEGVAISSFPVDGDDATGWIAGWVEGTRWRESLQAIVLGGITIAGLGLVDVAALVERLATPVLAVTRRSTDGSDLLHALDAAGLTDRAEIVARTPAARRVEDGLWVTHAGATAEEADALLAATRVLSKMPEPLRVAHLIGAALVSGQSRGRV